MERKGDSQREISANAQDHTEKKNVLLDLLAINCKPSDITAIGILPMTPYDVSERQIGNGHNITTNCWYFNNRVQSGANSTWVWEVKFKSSNLWPPWGLAGPEVGLGPGWEHHLVVGNVDMGQSQWLRTAKTG